MNTLTLSSSNNNLNTMIVSSYVHQFSLAFSWIYLMYMHYHAECSEYVIWLHQTLALRLVGLAFELHITDRTKTELNTGAPNDQEVVNLKPPTSDIISYAYYFIGIHKGN